MFGVKVKKVGNNTGSGKNTDYIIYTLGKDSNFTKQAAYQGQQILKDGKNDQSLFHEISGEDAVPQGTVKSITGMEHMRC